MSDEDLLKESLKSFRNLWSLSYPEKGERRRRGSTVDLAGLQSAWNSYVRMNVIYHGTYIPASDPNFLKH